jgi:hypothetical protein
MKKWTPRGSAIGYYYGCQMRALFDRAFAEDPGLFDSDAHAAVEAKKGSSGYADLGTVIHYDAQTKLKAEFPRGDHAPNVVQWANATSVFKGNQDACKMAVQKASDHLAKVIGPDPDGRNWLAEVSVKRPWVTGHIDLLSSDATELVDIKTTSKPPYYSHVPPSHVLQTLAYVQALSEQGLHVKKIRIVYIASQSVDWYMDCPFDPCTPDMMQMREDLVAFGLRLKSAAFLKPGGAVPNIGDACENWCPYTSLCRDKYAVKKGDQKPVAPPPQAVKTLNPFGFTPGTPARTLANHKE